MHPELKREDVITLGTLWRPNLNSNENLLNLDLPDSSQHKVLATLNSSQRFSLYHSILKEYFVFTLALTLLFLYMLFNNY